MSRKRISAGELLALEYSFMVLSCMPFFASESKYTKTVSVAIGAIGLSGNRTRVQTQGTVCLVMNSGSVPVLVKAYLIFTWVPSSTLSSF